MPPRRISPRRFGGDGSDDFVVGAFTTDGNIAGYAGFQREACLKGTLNGMYIITDFRGRHVGRFLLDWLIEVVRVLGGIEQLNLTVIHSNDSARTFYLYTGFVPFGLEKNARKAGGRYYDKEHMVLML